MKVGVVYPNLHGEPRPNLGVIYLATYINECTPHRAFVLDFTFHRRRWRKHLRKFIEEVKPDVLAVSCITHNFSFALTIARESKKLDPEIRTIFGGAHPTLCPEIIESDGIDCVCIGEGELTLSEYLDGLEKGSLENVRGIWYRDGGKIVKNEPRPLIDDLDSLPFPEWELVEIGKYWMISPYQLDFMASRGCPYNCTFCSIPSMRGIQPGRFVRRRSVESIREEIEENLDKYGGNFKVAFFVDDIFTADRRFLREFCEMMVNEGLNEMITWKCAGRVDNLNYEDLKMMRRANCAVIEFGIESGDEYMRYEIYRKRISDGMIMSVRKWCRELGISNQLNFIFGGPGETYETMQKTFRLARELDPEEVALSIFQPLPKTAARDIAERIGAVIHEGWDATAYYRSVMDNPSLKGKDVEKFVRSARRYFIGRMLLRMPSKIPSLIPVSIYFLLYLKPRFKLRIHDMYRITYRKWLFDRYIQKQENF